MTIGIVEQGGRRNRMTAAIQYMTEHPEIHIDIDNLSSIDSLTHNTQDKKIKPLLQRVNNI